jgi:hypothetical protein
MSLEDGLKGWKLPELCWPRNGACSEGTEFIGFSDVRKHGLPWAV